MSTKVLIRATCALATFLGAFFHSPAQTQCWASREVQDRATAREYAAQLKWMQGAEEIVRRNGVFLATPEPVRMRSTVAAGPNDPMGARLWVRAYPEKTSVGIRLWTGTCEVIPQAERVAGSIGAVGVFFNYVPADNYLADGEVPKRTGTVGGYPEYNGWVVLTKGGRLPWIPQTLGERLDRVGGERKRSYEQWKTSIGNRKAPDRATIQKTFELLKKTDVAGAQKYLDSMRQLEIDIEKDRADDAKWEAHFAKLRTAYETYRARFTPEQLAMPAVWADADGSAKRALDARIAGFQQLSPEEQAQVDALLHEARDLDRRAQAARKGGNAGEADRLQAQSDDLSLKVREIRKAHTASAFFLVQEATGEFDLSNLHPGDAAHAMAFKLDPTFPDPRQPKRAQVITVYVPTTKDRMTERDIWLRRVKEAVDWAALARLLD